MSSAKKKIFIFEDTDNSFSIFNNMLNEYYDCKQLTVADPYLEELQSERPVSLFINIDIPEFDYKSFMKELKVNGILSITSIILITSKFLEKIPLTFRSFGISDYIVRKDFTQKELYKTITHSIDKLKLQKDILKLNIQLEHLTEKDRLTGLFSRDCVKTKLSQEIDKVSRNIQTITAAILSIDYFSSYNDNYGYHVGDQILIKVSEVLKKFVRKTDILFRYSGEEFLILFINEAKALKSREYLLRNIAKACKKIQEDILSYTFKIDDKNQIKVYTSFGIALFNADPDVDTFLSRVDEALYHSGSHGKGKIGVYMDKNNIEIID